MQPSIILDNSPALTDVVAQRQAFEQYHGSSQVYYFGALCDPYEDNKLHDFPGALCVGELTDSEVSLLLFDNRVMWPIQPVEPYTFEIVVHDMLPNRTIYTIPADTLWPEWATSQRRIFAALEADGLDATLTALGFTQTLGVRGLGSIDALLPKKERSGIYILHFANGSYYVGQSVDITKRYQQHLRTYGRIEQLSYRPVPRKQIALDEAEIETIYILEEKGYALLNIIHASVSNQSSDFDLLMHPDDQKRWAATHAPQEHAASHQPRIVITEEQRLKQGHKFKAFQRRHDVQEITSLLHHYVTHCVPEPRLTEYSYWSVSCMPSTNASTFPRIACFNMNVMEVFVVGHDKYDQNQIWSFINIARSKFEEIYPSTEEFHRKYPCATIRESAYIAAGIDQLAISMEGIESVCQVLCDPAVIQAARLLSLHLMRKRTNIYGRYHCFDLADTLV